VVTVKVLKGVYDWIDERLEIRKYIKKDILDKPIPKGLNLSFCFGGITFFLFLILAVTGYFMMIYYVPSPAQAYGAVDYMAHEVALGQTIRGIHYWSANLMFVTICVHMIRVVIYGAYKKPRELTWISGVLLLILVMAFCFTGYLLPWDQKAYWATRVGTGMMGKVPLVGEYLLKIMRGGEKLGTLTLVRFYFLHVIFLPAATVCLLVAHFFMVRKQGVSAAL
jgi:quinol-cytochrome oxidoreductase complex cytochrome b subunit